MFKTHHSKFKTIQALMTNLSLHEQQLLTIVQNINIIDDCSYTLYGETERVYNQQNHFEYCGEIAEFGENTISDAKKQDDLLRKHLSTSIYYKFYCGLGNTGEYDRLPMKRERTAFMNKLSKFNYSTNQPDTNWTVYAIQPNGLAFASKNGTLRPAVQNTFVPNAPLSINHTISFYRVKENRKDESIFYFVNGNEYFDSDCAMLRIYFNIEAEGAQILIQQVTHLLNDYRVPFHFKCLNHPSLYNRNDGAVLYLNKENISIINILLPQIIEPLQAYFKQDVPFFTTRLYDGISRAEDPGGGQSFGDNRCKIIAKALVEAFKMEYSKEETMSFVLEAFRKQGINPKRMDLNPHTKHPFLIN